MNFLEKLDFMMDKLEINKSKLSSMSGVPYTTIDTFYKKGYENTKLSTVKKIAEALDVSMDYLLVDTITDENYGKTNGFLLKMEEMEYIKKYRSLDQYGKEAVDGLLDCEHKRCIRQARERAEMEASADMHIIPFRRSCQPASAGTGAYLGPDEFETIYVQENSLTSRASFGVPVSGDSMEPDYHDGDVLLVERAEDIRIGEVGVFTIDGDGFVKERGDGELISLNSAYAPIQMNESIRCNGRVIGVLEPEWIVGK